MWGREFSIHFTASDAVTWLSPPLKRKALKKKKKWKALLLPWEPGSQQKGKLSGLRSAESTLASP